MNRGVVAALLFAAFLALGVVVSTHAPSAFDRSELGVFGTGVAFAVFCHAAGQFPPYAALCALALVAGLIRRAYLPAALWAVGLLLVIWKTSDAFKDVFHRARPEHWLAVHETSASYPSGHATLSIAFYGFAAYVAWSYASIAWAQASGIEAAEVLAWSATVEITRSCSMPNRCATPARMR